MEETSGPQTAGISLTVTIGVVSVGAHALCKTLERQRAADICGITEEEVHTHSHILSETQPWHCHLFPLKSAQQGPTHTYTTQTV